jgi:hypothetical protein
MKGRANLPAHLQDSRWNESEKDDGDYGIPDLANGEYQAFGPVSLQSLVSLHFIRPDGTIRSFQYRHLDSDSLYQPGKLVLRFLGWRPTMVVIEGQQLLRLYDYVHQDRVPWVMQAARDFREKDKPIVSKLHFVDLIDEGAK